MFKLTLCDWIKQPLISTNGIATQKAATNLKNISIQLAVEKERIGLAHVVVKIWSMVSPATTSSNFLNSPCVTE